MGKNVIKTLIINDLFKFEWNVDNGELRSSDLKLGEYQIVQDLENMTKIRK